MKAVIVTGVLAATGGVFYTATDALSSSDSTAQIAALEAEVATARTEIDTKASALTAQVSALESANKDLTGQLETDRAAFETALGAARQEITDANAEVARLEGIGAQSADLLSEIAALKDTNVSLQAENVSFVDQNATLQDETAKMRDTLAALQSELQTLQANPTADGSTLAADLTAAREEVTTLQGRITDLEAELAAATAQTADPATAEQIIALQAALDEQAQALEAAEASHAATTEELRSKLADFETETARLTTALDRRDAEISDLWTEVVTREDVAPVVQAGVSSALADCQARTNAILADTSIGFDSGRTTITNDSVALLEELAEIAAECVSQDLAIDIEGHTDSAGGEASNLLLSNGRAQAVFDFFAARDVPADRMRAIGFGETDPIADNETTEGRAENRRIVLDWSQR